VRNELRELFVETIYALFVQDVFHRKRKQREIKKIKICKKH